MNIRSITYFCDPGWPINEDVLRRAGEFLAAAKLAFEAANFTVQTARLATVPFSRLLVDFSSEEVIRLAQTLEGEVRSQGFEYLSLGPALPEIPQSYSAIPGALEATEVTFFSGAMSSPEAGIALRAVHSCAEAIHRISLISPDGFANLRFAALAGVPPGAPFFPAAYHEGGSPTFALATEAADLAVVAVSDAGSLTEVRHRLIERVEDHTQRLILVGEELAEQFGVQYSGIDFSLAPFPEEDRSLGTAIERLGVPGVGLHGSLAAAAFLADTLDATRFRRVGFSGIMLPVLEDAILAARAAEGKLSITDLLLYSAVCGTGLDTLPLPGDTSPEQIAAILLDLAALAQRLDKPLTARLMPIPGKAAGDPTGFDFAYFANSRVMDVRAEPLKGLLRGEEDFRLHGKSRDKEEGIGID